MIFILSSLHPSEEDTTAEFVDRNKYILFFLFTYKMQIEFLLYSKDIDHRNLSWLKPQPKNICMVKLRLILIIFFMAQ